MRRFIPFLIAFATIGCQDLKEQQVKPYIGDSETKTYFKNVPDLREKIPANRQVTFNSTTDAEQQGYTSAQEANQQPE